jgi:excisionase family DNA binding protein
MASTGELRERKFTVAEVAEQLAVSPMTIRRLIQVGDLRAYRIGSSIRIPVSALREFLGGAATQDGDA